MSKRQYYSMRTGKTTDTKYDWITFRRLVVDMCNDFGKLGYFLEAFGSPNRVGTIGTDNIKSYFERKLRKGYLWPFNSALERYTEDDLFDLLEFLFDHVSKPVSSLSLEQAVDLWLLSFDRETGQKEFLFRANEILCNYGEGYRLSEDGEILLEALPGTEELLEAALPEYDPENVEQRVQMAVEKYRHSRDSMGDRRDAVRDLGDVFEFLRPKVKQVLSKKDEGALFSILNEFGIRHHEVQQKTDYDEAIWLDWLFYFYLAGIHACLRLIKKQEEDAES